jgi:cell division protein FtsI (penicillin-binding protein 3)
LKRLPIKRRRRRSSARVSDRRIRLMRTIVLLMFLALAGRLVDLQAFSGARYSEIASGQVANTQQTPALRGGIYDRNGTVLAISVQRSNVVADPYIIHDPGPEAVELSGVLDVGYETIYSDLKRDSGFVYVAKLVDQQVADKVAALDLPGINLIATTEQIDPAAPLASPLIGTVAANGNGNSGLEYQYNSLLSGHSGTITDEESPSGVVLPDAPTSGSTGSDGDGVELTLDEPLQYVAESALSSALVSTHAQSGTVIVMDVHSGDILAMANLVSDPATGQVDEAPQNLALTSVYEPGSVFKLVTFSAALQAGAITPKSVVTVPPSMTIDGSVFHDAETHPTEKLTATQILAQSSNLGTIEIAQKIGQQAVFDQMQRLGIGRLTGLGFPGESPGLVEPLAKWGPTDLASTVIGQNTAVTPMQVLDMMNTVASGGTYVPPRLVQAIVSPDGKLSDIPTLSTHREISESVTSQLTGMLEQVVSDGTAPGAAIPGYTVAGKTGTAQIPNQSTPGYEPGAYMATFTGFAPAQDPSLSAIVVLNRPTPIFGGVVAGPVFSQVMSYALDRFGIPSDSGTGGAAHSVPASVVPLGGGPRPPVSRPPQAPPTQQAKTPSSTGATKSGTKSKTTSTPDRSANASGSGPPGTIARSAGQNARSP